MSTSPAESAPEAPRYTVKAATIDPMLPEVCVGCLADNPQKRRRLTFRRSDGTVERVAAVHWPTCDDCLRQLAALDRQQRLMTLTGFVQTVIVIYAVLGAVDLVEFWYPSLGILGVFFWLFTRFAKKARTLWGLEWARIDDVYKGGIGAAYSFRNRVYAERFAALNENAQYTRS